MLFCTYFEFSQQKHNWLKDESREPKVFALYLHTHACVTGSFINGKVDVQDVDECTELCIINGSCRTVSDIWLEKGQSRDFILVLWFSLNQERKCGLIQEPCMASKRSGAKGPGQRWVRACPNKDRDSQTDAYLMETDGVWGLTSLHHVSTTACEHPSLFPLIFACFATCQLYR